jgi:hypothetical protein
MSTSFDCSTSSAAKKAVHLSDRGTESAVVALCLRDPLPAEIAAIQAILKSLAQRIDAYANGDDLNDTNLRGIFHFLAKCVGDYMDADELEYTPPMKKCSGGVFRQLLDCRELIRQLAFSLDEFMYGFVFSGFEIMGTLDNVDGFPEPDFAEWTVWILELLEKIRPIEEW